MEALQRALKASYVIFAFCAALFIGALKGVLVGPFAALVLILGNVGVLICLFPAHVYWAAYTLFMTDRINGALKLALLFALPILFGLWLVLGIVGSVIVGLGYGFFTPWVSTFEAFRQSTAHEMFFHSVVDGTWWTIKGSCTVVRDFADICYHSYPIYLKELRESCAVHQLHTIRLVDIPSCIVVGLMGIIIEIPLYTIIAVVKSPYMLFKGWNRLMHDLICQEGPFFDTACVPIAGLAIVLWPIVVVGSVLLAILSSIFIGLYGSVIVYQERSFGRGVAYILAMVSEFDEYTNDWLYLREGSFLPKPHYRKRKIQREEELSVGSNIARGRGSSDPPAMLVPSLAPSRSVRETIKEVKMVQIWEELMKACEMEGMELLRLCVITSDDLNDWLRTKCSDQEGIIGVGLPSYSILRSLLYSIKAGSDGILLSTGEELNQMNCPQDRLLDWFFHPVMVLKEQIKIIKLGESEVSFLENITFCSGDVRHMKTWDNGALVPQDPMRAAQIQAISRRLVGMTRSVSKFPTYRRRYQQVVKALVAHSLEKDGSSKPHSSRLYPSFDIVQDMV